FEDLVFNVGLRVDRFDANQQVLKDPYLMQEAKTVAEVDGSRLNDFNGEHPSNIGNGHVVYVNAEQGPSDVLGYRKGNEWFNANGEPINDPEVLNAPG
ncbi:MAG: hypothetical protein ABEH43_03220, partial [Flavobacteriales bacterium]